MKLLLTYFMLASSLMACIDAYDVTIRATTGYLVIDGGLTDADEPQSIYLSRTDSTQSSSMNQFTETIIGKNKPSPVSNATVNIIVNNNQVIKLVESNTTAGKYDFPVGFQGKIGDNYQLKIQIKGLNYESLVEKMLPTSSIKKVYDNFNIAGVKQKSLGAIIIPTNDIFIDFDDDPSQQNFYRWTSKVYEVQNICKTCRGGRYFWLPNQINIAGDCFIDSSLPENNILDYPCATPTWDIFYSSDLNIFSDANTNGKAQIRKLVAQILLRQANPCLIAIQQQSLTPDAFKYFKLINDQATNNGGLVDTPPGRLQGNVKCISKPEELVLGFFTVSAVQESRYMVMRDNIDRSITKSYNNLFVFMNGRDPYYEGQTLDHPKQVFAIGVDSHTRTIIKPKGWQDIDKY